MHFEYRGYSICAVEADLPTIELVEVASGTRLPTKIVGGTNESMNELAERARRLCDLYAGEVSRLVEPLAS